MTHDGSDERTPEESFVERLDELVTEAEDDGVVVEKHWTCHSMIDGMSWDVEFVRANGGTNERADGGDD